MGGTIHGKGGPFFGAGGGGGGGGHHPWRDNAFMYVSLAGNTILFVTEFDLV